MAEQLAHGAAQDAVGVRFQAVDLFAGLEGRLGGAGVGQAAQQTHGGLQALAALHRKIGQARDLLGHVAHVVQRHGLGGVLQQVGHVVHQVDQRMDLLAVDRGDERGVDQPVDLGRHTVGRALGVVHFQVVFLAQLGVAVVAHQVFKRFGTLDDAVGVLVEKLKKIALFGQQFAEQHGGFVLPLCVRATCQL